MLELQYKIKDATEQNKKKLFFTCWKLKKIKKWIMDTAEKQHPNVY